LTDRKRSVRHWSSRPWRWVSANSDQLRKRAASVTVIVLAIVVSTSAAGSVASSIRYPSQRICRGQHLTVTFDPRRTTTFSIGHRVVARVSAERSTISGSCASTKWYGSVGRYRLQRLVIRQRVSISCPQFGPFTFQVQRIRGADRRSLGVRVDVVFSQPFQQVEANMLRSGAWFSYSDGCQRTQ
jgi:hypothetical protein